MRLNNQNWGWPSPKQRKYFELFSLSKNETKSNNRTTNKQKNILRDRPCYTLENLYLNLFFWKSYWNFLWEVKRQVFSLKVTTHTYQKGKWRELFNKRTLRNGTSSPFPVMAGLELSFQKGYCILRTQICGCQRQRGLRKGSRMGERDQGIQTFSYKIDRI